MLQHIVSYSTYSTALLHMLQGDMDHAHMPHWHYMKLQSYQGNYASELIHHHHHHRTELAYRQTELRQRGDFRSLWHQCAAPYSLNLMRPVLIEQHVHHTGRCDTMLVASETLYSTTMHVMIRDISGQRNARLHLGSSPKYRRWRYHYHMTSQYLFAKSKPREVRQADGY